MEVKTRNYTSTIILERDCRKHISDYINLNRKIMIISDEGVPSQYVETIQSQCANSYVYIVEQGEGAKSLKNVEKICIKLYELQFDEQDLIFAVGGGVVGDLSGYVASIYKLGIPYVSLPTTTLSQVDSSIGGKTAVNLDHVKNIIGSFCHPEVVFIDLNTLATLSHRQYYSGLVESLKAGMIRDPKLFELFENNKADFNGDMPPHDLEEIIERSLLIKRDIVEADEKEQGLRKLLNFGHTFGHAIESIYDLHVLTHGESVGIGMMMILKNETIKEQLKEILIKMKMPYEANYEKEEILRYITNDKKAEGDMIDIVQVDKIGKGYIKKISIKELETYI